LRIAEVFGLKDATQVKEEELMRDQPFTTSHELSPPAARPDRRFVLKAAVGGTILSTLGAATAQSPQALLDDYTPAYFNAAEWTFIRSACARLIPSDGDGPGAIEAQVPVFIDKQMAGEFGKASDWCMIASGFRDQYARTHARGR
jgi:Gluconate 2-dehydrogenase subunit 3